MKFLKGSRIAFYTKLDCTKQKTGLVGVENVQCFFKNVSITNSIVFVLIGHSSISIFYFPSKQDNFLALNRYTSKTTLNLASENSSFKRMWV
jgi:hypothetical protein